MKLSNIHTSFCLPIILASYMGSAMTSAESCGGESQKPPTKYAVMLFDGFQALDVFGPIDILNSLSTRHPLELSILSVNSDTVSTIVPGVFTIGERVVPTHTLQNPPEDIEVLLVPGGLGTYDLEHTQPNVDFIKTIFPKLRYLLTVCTGSALAARAGVLDGKSATSNKSAFDWVMTQGPKVNWIRHARWVNDTNTWSSSGVSAGIDMMFAFILDQYGEDDAAFVARFIEYVRNMDASNDPFSDPTK